MKNMVKLISPAKVNLVLAVGNKRADGFHEVTTIMHSLSLHDTLTMRRFEEDENTGLVVRLTCETSGDIAPLNISSEENIAYKAVLELARALSRNANETLEITLSKTIPAQAGLGGGSSNAAAALLGAATLWGVDLQDAAVREVAASLGADVSFFLHGGCVRLSGKGDVFEAALEPRTGFVLLVRPDVGVSTAQAYNTFDQKPSVPDVAYLESLGSYTTASEVIPWNNLEEASCSLAPAVAEVATWAQSAPGVIDSVLCGSGSAVCLMCVSYDAACACSVEAHKRGWWSRVTSFSRLGAAVVKSF